MSKAAEQKNRRSAQTRVSSHDHLTRARRNDGPVCKDESNYELNFRVLGIIQPNLYFK